MRGVARVPFGIEGKVPSKVATTNSRFGGKFLSTCVDVKFERVRSGETGRLNT